MYAHVSHRDESDYLHVNFDPGADGPVMNIHYLGAYLALSPRESDELVSAILAAMSKHPEHFTSMAGQPGSLATSIGADL